MSDEYETPPSSPRGTKDVYTKDEKKWINELKNLTTETKNYIYQPNQQHHDNIEHNKKLERIKELQKKIGIYEEPKTSDYDVKSDHVPSPKRQKVVGGKSRRRRRKTKKKKTRKAKKKTNKKKRKGNKKRKTRARTRRKH